MWPQTQIQAVRLSPPAAQAWCIFNLECWKGLPQPREVQILGWPQKTHPRSPRSLVARRYKSRTPIDHAGLHHTGMRFAEMAACFTAISSTPAMVWRHLRSGLRRKVPSPGARRIYQHAIQLAGEALHAVVALMAQSLQGVRWTEPLRAIRGFSASKRCADVSKAYRRPVLRMAKRPAPMSYHQRLRRSPPPFHCAWRRPAWPSNWEPSSCTSKSPRRKASFLFRAGLPRNAQAPRERTAWAQP